MLYGFILNTLESDQKLCGKWNHYTVIKADNITLYYNTSTIELYFKIEIRQI